MTSGSPGIRLKVAYKSPEALVGELTKSVGRGGVRIECARSVAIGTRFVFELRAQGVDESVDVVGTVLSVIQTSPGKFVLHIRYEPPTVRDGLDAILNRIFAVSRADPNRRSPRVPVHVRAVETRPASPSYRLRDLSEGGAGIDVDAETLPSHVAVGMPFLLTMKLTPGVLTVQGEVVWVVSAALGAPAPLPPRIGVAFSSPDSAMASLLAEFIELRAMPPPPWIAKLAFGSEAQVST